MSATIWIVAATYIVFLYPVLSINGSAPKQPVILPIHGKEFINAFLVAGSEKVPLAPATPN